MKRVTTVLIVLFVLVIVMNTTTAQPINFGVKAGLNFANFGGEESGDWSSRTGMAFGGYFEYPLSNTVSVQPEVIYTMKGARQTDRYTFQGAAYTETLTFKYNYLEIPVAGKLSIPLDNTNLTPVLFAGPSFAFRLSSGWEMKEEGDRYEGDDDRVKSFDFGFLIGGGAMFNIGARFVEVEIRYNMGLTSLDDSGNNHSIKNNVLMLMASYQIGVLNR